MVVLLIRINNGHSRGFDSPLLHSHMTKGGLALGNLYPIYKCNKYPTKYLPPTPKPQRYSIALP